MGCKNDISNVRLLSANPEMPLETAHNVEVLYSENALLSAKLTARTVNKISGENPYLEMTDSLKINFYDNENNVQSVLTANYGISYEKEDKMEARGNVVVINYKNEKLNTELLVWDERKQIIHSNAFVKITTEDEIIYGEGFESNQNFSQYKIFKIKGTIQLKEDEGTNEIH